AGTEDRLQLGGAAIGEDRLAVRGAVQRNQLAGAARDDDAASGGRVVVDEQRRAALANGQVRRLAGLIRQRFQALVAERDQAIGPVVLWREATAGRVENVIFPAVRIRQDPAALERCGEAEDAAAVDAEQPCQLAERHRVCGPRDRFENRQAAVQALYRGRF